VPGPVNIRLIQSAPVTNGAGDQTYVAALCPTGQKVTGGGIWSSSAVAGIESVNTSSPITDGSGWYGYVDNVDSAAHTIRAYALCAQVTTFTPPEAPPTPDK
jgi:hypothetical protein